jgi:hypothetical protein
MVDWRKERVLLSNPKMDKPLSQEELEVAKVRHRQMKQVHAAIKFDAFRANAGFNVIGVDFKKKRRLTVKDILKGGFNGLKRK